MNKHKLPVWEYMAKEMTFAQLDFVKNMNVLDFGSGIGVTADHFAACNTVTAIEPDKKSVDNRIRFNKYTQYIGGVDRLRELESESFDIILCHNVFEYIEDRKTVISEFYRLLKKGGRLSVIKHNKCGRVFQMAVLLNNFNDANNILDGKNGISRDYGEIRYYDDSDLTLWCPQLKTEKVYGIRTFWDLQQNQEIQKDESWQNSMLALEHRVSTIDEYRAAAFFHHILLQK